MRKENDLLLNNNVLVSLGDINLLQSSLISGHSGFMGYGDLWGFISQTLFIINPCLDLWGFMGIYGKPEGDIKSP